jgi:GDP/UDP-N,N'-diacetylbacillosamine 2-epimerase (hydrolysing)
LKDKVKNIFVLTSSRADYGIYLPLLKKIQAQKKYKLQLIVFGTHLSKKYGYSISQIIKDGFSVSKAFQIDTIPNGDSQKDITAAIGKTIEAFSKFWDTISVLPDLVLALGDRYEMMAAVTSIVPFGHKIAHLHGGEQTLGAIDDVFRNAITAMSNIHFTSTENYKKRVIEIIGNKKSVYQVGALSLDNLNIIPMKSKAQLSEELKIELKHYVLVTMHPETIHPEKNEAYIKILLHVLSKIKKQILFTLPNADTSSLVIRNAILKFVKDNKQHIAIENLGTVNYFNAMRHCDYLLGNTSSGIIEAASMNKYVIDIGDRQKGRLTSKNVYHSMIEEVALLNSIKKVVKLKKYTGTNLYGNGNSADKILKILANEL